MLSSYNFYMMYVVRLPVNVDIGKVTFWPLVKKVLDHSVVWIKF